MINPSRYLYISILASLIVMLMLALVYHYRHLMIYKQRA
tara:strand:+ start:5154 stop:5270 length:117 start_codon:yes stop_codon:yes gene_type:complete